ncbi:prostatic acid phosphatase-like [Mya arenaria]|uniref:prostatic acid phosphatase-like n=1 Tax=Mya arenaria TaxID=6604 RepID=UPI0022DF3708|nr:prostatic acid phosphatase-like [Mya arenaria]
MKNKWCLFVVFYVSFHACLCAETLRLVNLVYRHGDRSPIEIFPKDVNQIEKWPQGLGWLSKIGMKQHYALGQLLKTRYIDTGFMKEEYRRYEISIESSDEDRCLMSAYSNLAGMYPPDDDQKFNHDIPWQPIPVHTRPAYEDNMLNMGEACPRYDELLEKTMETFAIQEEEKRNKMFYQYLGNVSGWDHENISNIWRIADTLYCEKSHNLTVNTWADQKWNNTQTVFEKLRKLENFQFTLLYNGSEMSMLKGGPLLGRYIENMKNKMQFLNVATRMYMYSGHDTTVAALLSALGLFNDVSPQYTATVVVELHEDPSKSFYVNIFYKNQTYNDKFVPLTLPGCAFDCPFDQFVKLTKGAVPTDWKRQCGYPEPKGKSGSSGLSTGWIVSIGLTGLLVVVLVVGITCVVKEQRKHANMPYGRFDVSS